MNPLVIAPPAPRYDRIDVERLSIELHRVPMRRIAAALLALDSAAEEPVPLAATARA